MTYPILCDLRCACLRTIVYYIVKKHHMKIILYCNKILQIWNAGPQNGGSMRFNATKCYILSVRQKSSFFYQLNGTILQGVQTNPYLGVMLSSDMKWSTHINNICKKASTTLGFIRRNLRHSPTSNRKTAYISLVRSTLEYGATIWPLYNSYPFSPI